MFYTSHFGNGRQPARHRMLTTGLYQVGTNCSKNPMQLMELLCMTLSIRAFRKKNPTADIILYIPYIIPLIGHIHQKCTQYCINYIQILVDSNMLWHRGAICRELLIQSSIPDRHQHISLDCTTTSILTFKILKLYIIK